MNRATASIPRRQPVLLSLLAALVVSLASLTAVGPAAGDTGARVLVTATDGVENAVAAVLEAGGTIVDRFDTFGIVVADVPATGMLERDARIATLDVDRPIAPHAKPEGKGKPADAGNGKGGGSDAGKGKPGAGLDAPSVTAPQSIGADALHAAGYDGTGVGVAIIDTGITRSASLRDQVVASVDTSPDRNGRDGFGHGTFMAGLIAGQPDARTGFSGIAPGAHLVDIKVADRDGEATVAGVIAGLAAADRARELFDVKVVLLAAGAPYDADGPVDAMRLSLQQLWARGMVVVVPSGNDGPGSISTPGVDPYLITAGALDDQGTAAPDDDVLAEFSGSAADGSKPDVVAPGSSVVSTRSPGSKADRENPGSRIGPHLFRGSGTSMAAAITAGAAALLLDADEDLGPDEVKTRLIEGARQGGPVAGMLDVAGAHQADVGDANANGHLDPIELVPDTNDEDEPIVRPDGHSWVGHSWVGHSWVGHSWVGHSWVDDSWVGHSWVGHSWVGHSWVGHSWVGHSWVGHSWVGHSWVGHSWVGHSWIGHSWVGLDWSGGSWV